MATNKYPNQNVTMPMDKAAVQAARERGMPKGIGVSSYGHTPADGKGSRRQGGAERMGR